MISFKFKPKERKDTTDIAARAEKLPLKSKKKIAFKPASGERFVLFVGDEGAILVHLQGHTVLSRKFAPDASENNLTELKQALEKSPKAPLILIVDSMDQTYQQQTLPPVSSLSVNRLIKRRLDRDFANNDIKGAVLLEREKTGRRDWNFIMIALERSPQLSGWLNWIIELPNRFMGIHLVSTESENLIKALERGIGIPKEGTGAEWKFFMSHNKVGGFRQVILKNGKMIFTRLAQPLADANPEVIAGNIEQEMLSTIEYMKRLSYNPQTGLDVYIVASGAVKERIDTKKFGASSVQMFSPFEMAQIFGIEGATQSTDQFGDVILAAIIGASRKHVLSLPLPQYNKINSCYQMLMAQRLIAAISVVGMIGYSGYMGYEIFGLNGNITELERAKDTEEKTLAALRDTITKTNLDVELATDLIDIYTGLKSESVNPFPFLKVLQPLIVSPVHLKSIDWKLDDKNQGGADSKPINVTLTLELPGAAADPKARVLITEKIEKSLVEGLKGYQVQLEKTAGDKPNDQQFKVSSSKNQNAPQEQAPQNTDAAAASSLEQKVMITGPMPLKPVAAAAPSASGATP